MAQCRRASLQLKELVVEITFCQRRTTVFRKDYTLDLIDSTIFSKVKPIITSLGKIEEEFQPLLKRVNLHERQLQIMVDDVDQFKMEEAYVQTHMDLTVEVNSYFEKYQAIKAKVFDMIGSIIKKRKRKKLLNP